MSKDRKIISICSAIVERCPNGWAVQLQYANTGGNERYKQFLVVPTFEDALSHLKDRIEVSV